MKHNIIFAVLTVTILIFGFFAIDIVQIFSNNNNDENFMSIHKTENNAVYLSAEREIINPMASLQKSNKKISVKKINIASCIVTAMSRYNNTTYIAWGIDTKLEEAWKDGGNDLIYIDKWKYRNYGRKSERLLDCIINTNDYSIVYIRFYSEEIHELPASDLNAGLEKIRNLSDTFYPNLEVIQITMSDILNELKRDNTENQEYGDYYYEHEFYDYIGEINNSYYNENYIDYIYRYTDMKQFVDFVYPNSELHKFWLSPLDMCNIWIKTYPPESYIDESYIDESITSFNVNPVNFVLDEFLYGMPQWFNASYSAKDGRIYQTITLNDHKITVIYSVKEDMVEGFYFDINQ